eukprot:CAMPEP_0194528756 /NCGR_PEP_ID=MMETSP0253-20130528/65229_1 /TAXON_ID=2966 /ORGANISM="Noctiluca scintillans" /LENGTH=251 /DNA_ID=CAMNT_0039373831 /DNA_START=9 /DNA_END=764 /DNA_ORIENTATION=+
MPYESNTTQFTGFLRGLGATCKEPVCSRRNTENKRIHSATHFALGCQSWEEEVDRETSSSHAVHVDPQVAYATCDAPCKNASVVELRQTKHDPATHYRTEQRERFRSAGLQRRQLACEFPTHVHFGNDEPEFLTQTALTHFQHVREGSAALRAAGSGALCPTSMLPRRARCNPVTGGPRTLDLHDAGVSKGMKFDRFTANKSSMVHEAHERDPILGLHLMDAPAPRTSMDVVQDANATMPVLRSLGAVRPG